MMYGPRWAFLTLSVFLCLTAAPGQEYRVDTLAQSPRIALPASIAFIPDGSGDFFFSEKNTGNIRVFRGGSIRPGPFTTVSVTAAGEQGLHGLTFHPRYPDSPFVYAQYTRSKDRANVVVRLRDSSGVGVDPRTIVVSPRTNGATNHNGGSCRFGPDGKLYVSFGDQGIVSNAQDSAGTNVSGKILRLNPDGSIPRDNPFRGTPFWSLGHRNGFDFAFDDVTGTLYCTDNGPPCNDAVHRVAPRSNLTPFLQGDCTPKDKATSLRPFYSVDGPPPRLSGIVVYRARAFPRWRGKILFAGGSSPTLWALTLNAAGDSVGNSRTPLFTYGTGFNDIEVGPDGSIYLTSIGSSNKILRLSPVTPRFTSSPAFAATQGVQYSYTPTFSGTSPILSIVSGPEGMVVDTTTWTIHWIPTNEQALQRVHNVLLAGENGAGRVNQSFTISVANVNDPPGSVVLSSPPNDSSFTFTSNPAVSFAWLPTEDPDRDTVRYILELDTVSTFSSMAQRDTSANTNLSLRVSMPRVTRDYFWRVSATDGRDTVVCAQPRRLFISVVTAVQELKGNEKEKDREAILEQNFPNPFNPTTTINYTIPRGGYVRLSVFNLLGQEVAVVFEGTQSAGTYDLQFDKNQLPTGIYFYRIKAPGFAETRKMVITK